MRRKGSASNYTTASIYHRSVDAVNAANCADLQLLELENCMIDKTILQNLLNQPPNKTVNYRPRLNLKVDVEAIKEEKDRFKKENVRLQKELMMFRLQMNNLRSQNKRLKEFQSYFQVKQLIPTQSSNSELPQTHSNPKTESLIVVHQRKQIMELKTILIGKDNEIIKLKKIPSSSLLLQLELERQHLIEETIRLKAYITSRTEQPASEDMVAEVAKLLKEENQKLKGALRMCEHEKLLSKAKKSSVKRLNIQLQKQIVKIQENLKVKEAEVEMLTHENKNLMFKKVNQLKAIQQSKDKQEIDNLLGQIGQVQSVKKGLQIQNKQLKDELYSLKEKHKVTMESESQLQQKYEGLVRQYQQKLELAEQELKSFKQNYLKIPVVDSRKSLWNKVKQTSIGIGSPTTVKNVKPVRVNEIRAQILFLKVILRRNRLRLTDILKKSSYRMIQLQQLFSDSPFCFPSQSALKIARYLIEDSSREGSLDSDKSQQRAVLLSILRTCLPHCEPENPRDQLDIFQGWQKTIRIYSDKLIRKLSEMSKRGNHIILEDIEHILSELCIKKTGREMAYLETQIYGDVFNEDAHFSLDRLSLYVQSCLPDTHNSQ